MSLNDFAASVDLNFTASFSGNGQFSPFDGDGPSPLNWSFTGGVQGAGGTDNRTIREKTCFIGGRGENDSTYSSFYLTGSTGNTSGTQTIGRVYVNPLPDKIRTADLGKWKVNTEPVLSNGGSVDGSPSKLGFYTVAIPPPDDPNDPIDKKKDDPITINPPIDGITRVYPGDFMYAIDLYGGGKRWVYQPQQRFPQKDRTFFWTPNTDPVLESGGISGGKLVKPGTIMLPTKDFPLNETDPSIDGMRYFYEGQGVLFDGKVWKKLTPDAVPLYQETGPPIYILPNAVGIYLNDDIYPRTLEQMNQQKCFVFTTAQIDDSDPIALTITPDPPDEPYTIEMVFSWGMFEDRRVQGAPVIYDFGDKWSAYHKRQRQDQIDTGYYRIGGTLYEKNPVPDPEGNIIRRTITFGGVSADGLSASETRVENVDGEDLTNTFDITISPQVTR